MSAKETSRWALGIMAMIVIAVIFGFSLKTSNESLKEADQTIAHADYYIERYEERSREYEQYTAAQETKKISESEQASVDDGGLAEDVQPTEVQISWESCVNAANDIGMDEYSLMIMAGWLVREGYTWYDTELALLCAYCPLYYWSRGMDIGWGLSGYGSDPSYTDESLIWYSYGISQAELEILYTALKNPRYDIYGCDGVSYYGCGCIYESYVNGYTIRVWAE